MIKHLFKLIWNQKRKNIGLLFEMLFSFMVLFAVFSFILHNAHRYNESIGFDYKDVWTATLNWSTDSMTEVYSTQKLIREQLKNYPQIKHYTLASSNTPYSGSMRTSGLDYNDIQIYPYTYSVDHNFANVMGISVDEGRWFQPGDKEEDGIPTPIVINQSMREELFGTEPVLGKVIDFHEEQKLKIIGVVGNFKSQGEFSKRQPGIFFPQDDSFPYSQILLKVNDDANANFEAQLLKDLGQISKGWTIEISYMIDQRKTRLSGTLVPMIILLIICGFLIFNVALGLFGVLWQNINKRKEEIGIRRAMGATQQNIGWQFIMEVILLTTLSVLIGIFFAIQFPLLGVFRPQGVFSYVYFESILISVLFIYLLVFICAFYPSRQAAQLQPAMTLHEE